MRALAVVLPALFCASSYAAELPPKPARLGLCAACHGESGQAVAADAPHLAGQKQAYLRQALAAYRSGARDVAVMRAAVGALGESDLDQLATWYAAQSPGAPN
jgi:cytochrome c553